MSFTISKNKNEYIVLSYMNNEFKMKYKTKLWDEFKDLYYDKMININSLFILSNTTNLYNHINCNDKLVFDNINMFNDIKHIIKYNLNSQLNEWEKSTIKDKKYNFKHKDCIDKQLKSIDLNDLINYSKCNKKDIYNNDFCDNTELQSNLKICNFLKSMDDKNGLNDDLKLIWNAKSTQTDIIKSMGSLISNEDKKEYAIIDDKSIDL